MDNVTEISAGLSSRFSSEIHYFFFWIEVYS